MTAFACCDDNRRTAVLASSSVNGIDFLEVLDSDAPTAADRQRILRVHFLKAPAPPDIAPANVAISGGERLRDIRADSVSYDGEVLVIHLTAYGDYSPYRLQLVTATGSAFDATKLDPILSGVDFSFKVECPSDFDSGAFTAMPTQSTPPSPPIDYLTKDYSGYRQLMLDRMATLMPGWTERSPADLAVTLVETLAFVADQLSYRQDAVATEAYLGTARRRVSVRRHARLVDYFMHEGKNARVFVHFEVNDPVSLAARAQLLTAVASEGPRLSQDAASGAAGLSSVETFETLKSARLFPDHNSLPFYTWGGGRCVLPKGATSATLKGRFPNLQPGDTLIFEEIAGRRTGLVEDADLSRRHPVQLTAVTASSDPVGGRFDEPPTGLSVDVTEIEWAADDSLPFALWVSALVNLPDGGEGPVTIAVARGNNVLADHGSTMGTAEDLGAVPDPTLSFPASASPQGAAAAPRPVPQRFRPRLKNRTLTFAARYAATASARAALDAPVDDALPEITLTSRNVGTTTQWAPQRDLLGSPPSNPDFVIEVESDGVAYLRFGDDLHGRRPVSGETFTASYRTGGGASGNVAAEAIRHVAQGGPAIVLVRNPLPAVGGVDPESLEDARRKAPFAFRTQARAVTLADYEAIAGLHPQVQRAAAAPRWTGSWSTVFLTIDRRGGLPVDQGFEDEIREFLESYRLAGDDLEVNGPNFVSLEIAARVSVAPNHFRADVETALMSTFNNGFLPDGRPAVFNPDNFTFGQPVYLSPLYAAARAVEGVESISITTFQRQGTPSRDALGKGKLEIGRFEIARLDNNPDFPERGVLRLTLMGGK